MLLARHHSDAMPPQPKCLIFWALTLHDKIPMTNLGLIDLKLMVIQVIKIIPLSILKIIPKTGHLNIEEEPEQLLDAIKFFIEEQ